MSPSPLSLSPFYKHGPAGEYSHWKYLKERAIISHPVVQRLKHSDIKQA